MQNKLEAVAVRTEEAEGRINEVEDKMMGKDEAGEKRDNKILDPEGRNRELSDSMKRNNICVIGVPGEEEKERERGRRCT